MEATTTGMQPATRLLEGLKVTAISKKAVRVRRPDSSMEAQIPISQVIRPKGVKDPSIKRTVLHGAMSFGELISFELPTWVADQLTWKRVAKRDARWKRATKR